jgi:RimJ/RimL family protein N-acetyltransferase
MPDRKRPTPTADAAPARPSRWQGVLSDEQKAWCEASGIDIAYDPMQIGWVIAEGETESAEMPPAPISWRAGMAQALGFRRWTGDDLPLYRRLLGDPEVWRHMHEDWPGEMTGALARDLLAVAALREHHDVLAVTLNGVPVGQMRLAFTTDPGSEDTAELSYWLGRDHWGRGLGRALVRQATARAFADHAWLYRIVAFVHPDNAASARCLRRAGYHDRGHRDDGWSCFVIYRDTHRDT